MEPAQVRNPRPDLFDHTHCGSRSPKVFFDKTKIRAQVLLIGTRGGELQFSKQNIFFSIGFTFYRTCLFYGKLDKFIWLYLPILVLLIVNTIMCAYITYCVFKNRQQKRNFSVVSLNFPGKMSPRQEGEGAERRGWIRCVSTFVFSWAWGLFGEAWVDSRHQSPARYLDLEKSREILL